MQFLKIMVEMTTSRHRAIKFFLKDGLYNSIYSNIPKSFNHFQVYMYDFVLYIAIIQLQEKNRLYAKIFKIVFF